MPRTCFKPFRTCLRQSQLYPMPFTNTCVPSSGILTPHMIWAMGELLKVSPTPGGEYKHFLANNYREADASMRHRHSLANSYERRRGSQKVTVKISANNGFIGESQPIFVYPRGSYCKEYGPETSTLTITTCTWDTHSQAKKHFRSRKRMR
jgi:hypothetical protein